MKSTVRILVAAAVLGLAPAVFAQDQSTTAAPGGELERALVRQEQLVRELLQRLDAQDAANAELRRRVAALEALLPPSSSATPPPPAPDLLAATVEEATQDEAATRLEERVDALPRLTGYYDFEFFRNGRPGTFNEFRQHHMSIHIAKEYDKFRLFNEAEFEYGTHLARGPGSQTDDSHGELSVEQAWAEYVTSNLLTVRAGIILTPNYWNVNHYPNMTASTRRPLMVRRVFQESFVGVMGYGKKYWGDLGVGYAAYVANGEGTQLAEHDDNSAKAGGGRLEFDLPTRGALDSFKFNISGYVDTPAQGERTRTWGLESQARRGPFELLFEFARRRAVEDVNGVYVQPSYRLTDRLTTFYRYDRLVTAHEGETQANTWGVNLRPITPVSLKFEFFRSSPPGTRSSHGVASSLALAF